jgi:hypothetical protein
MPRQKNTKDTCIYWLVDTRPETLLTNPAGLPFYCGKTVKAPNSRLWTHFQTARKHPNRPISIRLNQCGEHVRIQLMEIVPADGNWAERERSWIRVTRFAFPGCVNVSDGGDGAPGNIPNAETRAKISAANKGRKQSPEHLAKLSASRKGRRLTPEHREKVGAYFRGRPGKPHTKEARAKISSAHHGRKQTPETIAARAAANTGKTRSAEVRLKMSVAQKKRYRHEAMQNA